MVAVIHRVIALQRGVGQMHLAKLVGDWGVCRIGCCNRSHLDAYGNETFPLETLVWCI